MYTTARNIWFENSFFRPYILNTAFTQYVFHLFAIVSQTLEYHIRILNVLTLPYLNYDYSATWSTEGLTYIMAKIFYIWVDITSFVESGINPCSNSWLGMQITVNNSVKHTCSTLMCVNTALVNYWLNEANSAYINTNN